jgi:hypothetical protein
MKLISSVPYKAGLVKPVTCPALPANQNRHADLLVNKAEEAEAEGIAAIRQKANRPSSSSKEFWLDPVPVAVRWYPGR